MTHKIQCTHWSFEKQSHVCGDCGSHDWHANVFWQNGQSAWFTGADAGEPDFWCSDCDSEVEIVPEDGSDLKTLDN